MNSNPLRRKYNQPIVPIANDCALELIEFLFLLTDCCPEKTYVLPGRTKTGTPYLHFYSPKGGSKARNPDKEHERTVNRQSKVIGLDNILEWDTDENCINWRVYIKPR